MVVGDRWGNNGKVIIFSNRIKQAVALGTMLHEKGFPMVVLYGKQEQDVRSKMDTASCTSIQGVVHPARLPAGSLVGWLPNLWKVRSRMYC